MKNYSYSYQKDRIKNQKKIPKLEVISEEWKLKVMDLLQFCILSFVELFEFLQYVHLQLKIIMIFYVLICNIHWDILSGEKRSREKDGLEVTLGWESKKA